MRKSVLFLAKFTERKKKRNAKGNLTQTVLHVYLSNRKTQNKRFFELRHKKQFFENAKKRVVSCKISHKTQKKLQRRYPSKFRNAV